MELEGKKLAGATFVLDCIFSEQGTAELALVSLMTVPAGIRPFVCAHPCTRHE